MSLREHIKDACEVIDSGVFTGDVLVSEAECAALEWYVLRWKSAINERKAMQPEEEL